MLLFADDKIPIAEDKYDPDYITRKLTEIYNRPGMKANLTKTKYVEINGNATDLEVDGKLMEVCKEYKYLGVTIAKEGGSRKK